MKRFVDVLNACGLRAYRFALSGYSYAPTKSEDVAAMTTLEKEIDGEDNKTNDQTLKNSAKSS